ncbi:alanine--tRNA ligase [Ktedonobacteria bacterium brp13]|nr:alanine--tRNA ligase [Ktedonobacteria bacterium brp13]
MMLSSDEVRRSFLNFFMARGHAHIPSASLVPVNDATVLFNTAGMQPLIPYLLGTPHPLGRRLVDIQKCLRTGDIEEVGDNSHMTFFEMLGFWSLGDYWKSDSLRWTFEWFTQELGLVPERISVTVFAGNADVPRDEESAQVWLALGILQERIYYLPEEDNWWPDSGQSGPCGPDSEIFYDTLRVACGDQCQPGCHCGKYVEIGNNVFIQYNKTLAGDYIPLAQRSIDVGLGLERIQCMVSSSDEVYRTDLFAAIIRCIDTLCAQREASNMLSQQREERLKHIIADHLRAATFILADGVVPSNVEQGYICRRLLRRVVRYAHDLVLPEQSLSAIVTVIIDQYQSWYPELHEHRSFILDELVREERRFMRTLARGLRELQKVEHTLSQHKKMQLAGKEIFRLFDTFGFPPELTVELASEHGLQADMAGFQELFAQHQERSRQANQTRFKGGLVDQSETTTKLHTATHLLQQALRDVLGEHVHQMGSNITPERLRFDFSHPQRLPPEQLQRVEEIVNQQIARNLQVTKEFLPLQEALQRGALAFFGERYPEEVSVYRIGDYSLEVCGGPHVLSTNSMGHFQITKTESIGQGTQRIRAIIV